MWHGLSQPLPAVTQTKPQPPQNQSLRGRPWDHLAGSSLLYPTHSAFKHSKVGNGFPEVEPDSTQRQAFERCNYPHGLTWVPNKTQPRLPNPRSLEGLEPYGHPKVRLPLISAPKEGGPGCQPLVYSTLLTLKRRPALASSTCSELPGAPERMVPSH